ncbi:MAG: tetratricopeptide repeat protein [Terracidiphilus sp.]
MALALTAACLAASGGWAHAQIAPSTLSQANTDLQAGEADKAIALLSSLPVSGPGAAQAQNLLCRVRMTLQQADAAVTACENAVRLDPQSSIDHMWLGRALGQKAGRASFLNAYSLGKRVRTEFEEAVRLDPRNADALYDLGDFYKEAPGIVGGGMDKAESIARRLDGIDPARAAQLRANMAEARKDYDTAERDFRQAIAVSPHPASPWINLAIFFRHHQRWSDMENAIHSSFNAAQHDKNPSSALYDGAGVLIETNRDPAFAARMLETYLAGSSKTEEGPAFIAAVRLGRLKQQLGDAAGADREFAAAREMAHEYNPPQESRH